MKTTKGKTEMIDGFVFYRSYFEAIETLSSKNRLIAYEAITNYALNGEETTGLPSRVLGLLRIAKANLDANRRKYLKKMNSKQQVSQREESVSFENKPIEKVLLPRKESKLITKDNSIENDDNYFTY